MSTWQPLQYILKNYGFQSASLYFSFGYQAENMFVTASLSSILAAGVQISEGIGFYVPEVFAPPAVELQQPWLCITMKQQPAALSNSTFGTNNVRYVCVFLSAEAISESMPGLRYVSRQYCTMAQFSMCYSMKNSKQPNWNSCL